MASVSVSVSYLCVRWITAPANDLGGPLGRLCDATPVQISSRTNDSCSLGGSRGGSGGNYAASDCDASCFKVGRVLWQS